MADEIDIANDRILADMERRIAAARQKKNELGSALCEECEEPMPMARRQIGATLCIECAKRREYRQRLYAR